MYPIQQSQQQEVDYWKSRFNLLYNWTIRYVDNGEAYCTTRYNIPEKRANIYSCDLDIEETYILHEVLKLAYIEARLSSGNADKFLEDLTTLITDRSLR